MIDFLQDCYHRAVDEGEVVMLSLSDYFGEGFECHNYYFCGEMSGLWHAFNSTTRAVHATKQSSQKTATLIINSLLFLKTLSQKQMLIFWLKKHKMVFTSNWTRNFLRKLKVYSFLDWYLGIFFGIWFIYYQD